MPLDIAEYLKRNRLLNPADDDGSAVSAIQNMQQVPPTQDNAPVQAPPDPTGTNTDSVPENIPQQTDEGISTSPISSSSSPAVPIVSAPVTSTQGQTAPKELYTPGKYNQDYETALTQQPMKEDYHPSGWRKVGAIAAGIGTGFLGGGVQGGVNAAKGVLDAPYNDKLQNYKQQLAEKQGLAGIEAGQSAAGQKYYLDTAKAAKENAEAGYADRGHLPTSVHTLQDAIDFRNAGHPSLVPHVPYTLDMQDGSKVSAMYDPQTRSFFSPGSNKPVTGYTNYHEQSASSSGGKEDSRLFTVTTSDGNQVHGFRQPDGSYKGVTGQTIPNVADAVLKDPSAEGGLKGDLGEYSNAYKILEQEKNKPGSVPSYDVQAARDALTNKHSQTADRNSNASAVQQRLAEQSKDSQTKRLDIVAKPYADLSARIAKLKDTLRQGNLQADAEVAAQLTSIMDAGPGSSVRANKDLIDRTMGGQSNYDKVKGSLAHWSTDPNAKTILETQRGHIQQLLEAVDQRNAQKLGALNKGYDTVLNSSDPNEHRRAANEAIKATQDIDTQTSSSQSGTVMHNGKAIPRSVIHNGMTLTYNDKTGKYEGGK